MDTVQIVKIDNTSPIYDELVTELGDPFAVDEELEAAFALYDEVRDSLHELVIGEYMRVVDEETARRNEA